MKTTVARKRFMDNHGLRGPSPEKRDEITVYIRDRIVSGRWQPGDLIPSRADLEDEFDTTPVTVQRAVQPLIEDGLLYAKRGLGTFVSDTLPHLNRFALVFPHARNNTGTENAFFHALGDAASILRKRDGVDIVCFYNLNGDLRCRDYLELVRQLKLSKFAGIISASPLHLLQDTPVTDLPGIPRVAFMEGPGDDDVNAIGLDGQSVKRRAFEHIQASGKHHPCVIVQEALYSEDYCGDLIDFVASLGLELRPEWIQFVNQQSPRSCTNLARLLFSANNKLLPDSIFMADDNTIPHVIKGVRAEQGDWARELTICAQANFPNHAQYELPVKLFGFDIPKLLQQAIDMVSRRRRGDDSISDIIGQAIDDVEYSQTH